MNEDMCYGNCIICNGLLKRDNNGSIEYHEEWLECICCSQLYDIDGTIIEEDN